MDHEFGSSFSRIKVFLEIKVKMSVISRMGQSHAQQVDGAWWPEASIPYHMDPSDHPCVLITQQLASPEQVIQERSRWKLQCFLWLHPRSYSPSFLQHSMGRTGQDLFFVGGLHGMNVRGESLGSSWKWSPNAVKLSGGAAPGWHLHCNLLRHGASGHPSMPVLTSSSTETPR